MPSDFSVVVEKGVVLFFCVIFAGVKNLVWIIVAMMVLGAVVPGCDDVPRYDGRLTAADSLIHDHADSALTMLEALTPSDLATEGDRAYHDLLLTQARYKCYKPATTDSAINRALAYYRAHPNEQEKLTRAYIYKGTVMEELGHPDSAMFYYKQAEQTASPDDYFNLGYINMRIATLYQTQYSQDTTAITRNKNAIHYFQLTNDTDYLISCYGDLGGFYGVKYPDSTEYYLKLAIELAQLSNSPKQYTYKSRLAGFYFYYNRDYQHVVRLSMDVFHNGKECSKETQFYYYAIWSYLQLGLLDSAKYVFNATPAPVDAVDSMNWHQAVADIAEAENNMITYGLNYGRSKDEQINIFSKRKVDKLKTAESEYDRVQAENREKDTKNINYWLIVSLIILSIASFLLIIHSRNVIKRNRKEREDIVQELTKTIKELENKQHDLLAMHDTVSQLVSCRADALNELFTSIKFKTNKDGKNNGDRGVRSIVTLSSVISGLSEIYHPLKVDLPESFWEKIKRSVDGEFKGIATYVENTYPDLTDKEFKLFCLLCANISPQIIKLCLNYTNAKTISNYRTKLIKVKMGLDLSFDDFIHQYISGKLN